MTAEVPDPPWRVTPKRRASRGPRPPLDRQRIVTAALAIVDADGVDALSLRRLADDLRVTPMSLYWHVADKAELLELVGHAVLAEIELPEPKGDWKAQLRDVHRAMFDVFLRHPNAAELAAGRARFGPDGLAAFERILDILLREGVTPEAAFDAYQSLYLFMLGVLTTSSRTPSFMQAQREGWTYMASLPEDRYPAIRAVVPVIGRRPGDEQLETGLAVVLEGISARLVNTRRIA